MARPQKKGLEYFPLDVDIFSPSSKLKKVIRKSGLTGFAIIIMLYMHIYSQGYFCSWTEEDEFEFYDSIKQINLDELRKTVDDSVNLGIFDKTIYTKYKVLTSEDIQARYFEACCRRKEVEVINEYLLIKTSKYTNIVNGSINPVNVDINFNNDDNNTDPRDINVGSNPVNDNNNFDSSISNVDSNPQSKVNNSKVNCMKIDNTREEGDINSYTELGEFLDILKTINSYPFDINQDTRLYKALIKQFEEVNILKIIKSWQGCVMSNPSKLDQNPREYILNYFNKCNKRKIQNKGCEFSGGNEKFDEDGYENEGYGFKV